MGAVVRKMHNILLALHIIISVSLIALVLVQHGKGADMGLLQGSGSAGSLFGGGGSGSFIVKLTALLAVLFFVSSISLGYYESHSAHQVTSQIVESEGQD